VYICAICGPILATVLLASARGSRLLFSSFVLRCL